MSLYFDTRVQNLDVTSVSSIIAWHSNLPLLAVAVHSQEKGCFISVYDDQGEHLSEVKASGHSVVPITALAWHPERKWLAVAWENGEICLWCYATGSSEFRNIVTPHKYPVSILQWSQYGGHLVSGDNSSSLVGWKVDEEDQLFMVFHHILHQSLTHITFKISPTKPTVDMSSLAKAAVAGDERALDLFSSWRPRTAMPLSVLTKHDNYAFYVGTANGIIYYVDNEGQCSQVLNFEGATIYCLLHHQTRESIVIMSEGLHIGHFQTDPVTGQLTELTKVKLSARSDMTKNGPSLCWAGINTLAILVGELMIRMWDLHTGDTYILTPSNNSSSENYSKSQEVCTSLSFCKHNDTLAAGTNLGTIYFWKRKFQGVENDENSWPTFPNLCSIPGTVKQITWGAISLRSPLLAVNCITNVYILHQQSMCAVYNDKICASQVSPMQLHIEIQESENQFFILKTDIQIQLVAVNRNYIAVSSGKYVVVYKVSEDRPPNTTVLLSFSCNTEKLLIHDSILIVLTSQIIQLRSIEDGTIIQTLPTLSAEGEPIIMEMTGDFLTVASLNGILKIWNLGKREAKLHTRPMATYEVINDFAEIIEAKCNSDCRYVSITVAMANLMPSPILYVWDIENDQIHEFDFSKNDIEDESTLVAKCKGRLVTAHCWDNEDPRLLICQAQKPESINVKSTNELIDDQVNIANVVLITMFITTEHGIVVHDIRSIKDDNCRLLGVQSPFVLILDSEKSIGSKTVRLLMRDFEELDSCDSTIKRAILDFSFYLSVANMDEAFKAIKTIQNEAVWKSLAKMCVKTKQLDMAILCLGHMKQVRSVRALREAILDENLNLEAKVGILAVELKLYNDAERLFREANRFDLLGSLLEARNKFKEAIELAKNEDKIREKLSYYNYAKSLEFEGKISEAIEMYTKSDCHRFEVPRMLLSTPKELQNYLKNSDDLEIKNWHAQYTESTNDMEAALELYEQAQDTLSMTRLLCFFGRDDEACDLVVKSKHAASIYHLATYYEARGNFTQAIHFYTMSRAYTNAIRVCKENNLFNELWPLSMMAPKQTQIDVAKFYEEIDQVDKAILLYHKAGFLKKALELAFKTQQFNALQLITMDVNADSDPELIEKCAEYFVQNSQIDKAVDLLATGKNYTEALKLIQDYGVILSEELAEKMTLDKTEKDLDREQVRIATLEKIGEIALNQGNYHLATKKFTQAGNKFRAMKALLKSGDTEKICFFAQVSRQREIYVMAGNYLQSLDWQNQPEVLKNIINFYSKGKAMDLLANFYVACGQVEIDEFQNYEKALDALNQASKCLAKVIDSKDPDTHKRAVKIVNDRMLIIKKYLEIKKLFDSGETEMGINHIRYLLDSYGVELEQSIRRGDLFSMITQHYASIGEMEKARIAIEELNRLIPGINLSYYINANLLESLGFKINVVKQESEEREDDIEELLGE
ncbi:PREDICTED: intraflagellar transport protein 140 homolog [Ceratosolen solmsi marchali]|uniref:Intraflagellar transport protein 140 homolog n=1 Tax=Ceratosolen solmsi marchali TaxID=326594 RepID=A0AAJ6YS16_9HYME|nr:PREDICTED: intraflagellar transport protein 140 homolog [Ceratosolen solmsi marchali]